VPGFLFLDKVSMQLNVMNKPTFFLLWEGWPAGGGVKKGSSDLLRRITPDVFHDDKN